MLRRFRKLTKKVSFLATLAKIAFHLQGTVSAAIWSFFVGPPWLATPILAVQFQGGALLTLSVVLSAFPLKPWAIFLSSSFPCSQFIIAFHPFHEPVLIVLLTRSSPVSFPS